MSSTAIPRVGVGVFVFNAKNEFILGRRKGSHGAGTWALPGGHLDFGESFEDCASREVLEETGLDVGNLRLLTATNDVMHQENKHYVTVFMVCEALGTSPIPRILEPDKCEGWEWVSWEELKGWALAEPGGNEGEATEANDQEVPRDKVDSRRLFLPLLSLLRHRPNMQPQSSI